MKRFRHTLSAFRKGHYQRDKGEENEEENDAEENEELVVTKEKGHGDDDDDDDFEIIESASPIPNVSASASASGNASTNTAPPTSPAAPIGPRKTIGELVLLDPLYKEVLSQHHTAIADLHNAAALHDTQQQRPGCAQQQQQQGQEMFFVASLLKARKKYGRVGREYLVRWEGYGPDEDSWEPRANINNPDLVDAYDAAEGRARGAMQLAKTPTAGGHDGNVLYIDEANEEEKEEDEESDENADDEAILVSEKHHLNITSARFLVHPRAQAWCHTAISSIQLTSSQSWRLSVLPSPPHFTIPLMLTCVRFR